MTWNPQTYLQFAGPRTRRPPICWPGCPAEAPGRVIDLGCGPGNSTALLAARWPEAGLEGLDSSPAMLAEARASGVAGATGCWPIWPRWSPAAPYDVIYSNATFQWLADQADLLPRLMGFVAPGGVFAFQVPVNFHAPSHALMREVAADPRWTATSLPACASVAFHTAEGYYDLLQPACPRRSTSGRPTYLHVLEGEDAVYRWVSGTGLRPYLCGAGRRSARRIHSSLQSSA